MRTISLPIQGMTCGGCVASATKALRAVAGVRDARVSLEQGQALVTADEQVSVEALANALERVGFSSQPGSELA